MIFTVYGIEANGCLEGTQDGTLKNIWKMLDICIVYIRAAWNEHRGSYGITFSLFMTVLQYMLLKRGLFYLLGFDTRNVFTLAKCSMGIL